MPAPILQFKRGLLANLPGLRAGEPGFTTDKYNFYVGLTSETSTNQLVGSGRYWTADTASRGSGVNLVESSSTGSNYITIASPASLAGIVTYFFPGTQGAVSSVLTNDGSGNLTWSSGSANPVFTGIATFTDTTDNTLGNADTGSVQIDGGLGVNKNVTVGGNLNVQGYSEFVGVVTFKGGTINLGDANTDDINVSGEFISSLVPSNDNSYDVGGDATKQWRHANFAGIGTFDGGLDIGGEATFASATVEDLTDNRVVIAGTGGVLEDDANFTYDGTDLTVNSAIVTDLTSGRVVLAGTNGAVEDSGNLTFNGTTLTVTGAAAVDNVTIDGNTVSTSSGGLTLDSNGGTVTVDDDFVVTGTFTVTGSQTIVNTEILKVEDSLIEVGLVDSSGSLVPPSSNTLVDVGTVMHYYKNSAAKIASVFWDYSGDKIVAASDVTETNGTISVTSYADFEIGSLYVNDCAGSSQVITCSGTERFLENITVDGGSF